MPIPHPPFTPLDEAPRRKDTRKPPLSTCYVQCICTLRSKYDANGFITPLRKGPPPTRCGSEVQKRTLGSRCQAHSSRADTLFISNQLMLLSQNGAELAHVLRQHIQSTARLLQTTREGNGEADRPTTKEHRMGKSRPVWVRYQSLERYS